MERINLSRAFRDAADKAEPHVRRNALRAIYAKCPIKFSDDDLNIILDLTVKATDDITRYAAEKLDEMERLMPPGDGSMVMASLPLAAMLAGKQVEALGSSAMEAALAAVVAEDLLGSIFGKRR